MGQWSLSGDDRSPVGRSSSKRATMPDSISWELGYAVEAWRITATAPGALAIHDNGMSVATSHEFLWMQCVNALSFFRCAPWASSTAAARPGVHGAECVTTDAAASLDARSLSLTAFPFANWPEKGIETRCIRNGPPAVPGLTGGRERSRPKTIVPLVHYQYFR